MPELTIHVTLTVDTALSVGAGGSGGVLADKAIVRNRLNHLVLPGSHLKGRLRHACEIIARNTFGPDTICDPPRAETMCPQVLHIVDPPCPICALFGSPAWPSPLQFADLIYAEPVETSVLRPGASINRRRRTVEEQRLFFIETSPPAALAQFDAPRAITGWLPDDSRAEGRVKLLLAGLELIQSWGGGKSRGLGWGTVECQTRLGDQTITLTGLSQAIGGLG
ncbi:MAG: hypothetical protein KJZ86_08025 [Caldilineaceae bacterium]|nr:hypothetical protein [Caldilineaceae bacterium]HRJ40284.1 RAMP superfamily CRISPR-associated protein [Caldilineaceae bacterium]